MKLTSTQRFAVAYFYPLLPSFSLSSNLGNRSLEYFPKLSPLLFPLSPPSGVSSMTSQGPEERVQHPPCGVPGHQRHRPPQTTPGCSPPMHNKDSLLDPDAFELSSQLGPGVWASVSSLHCPVLARTLPSQFSKTPPYLTVFLILQHPQVMSDHPGQFSASILLGQFGQNLLLTPNVSS